MLRLCDACGRTETIYFENVSTRRCGALLPINGDLFSSHCGGSLEEVNNNDNHSGFLYE
jgi:hypothetical protein